MWDFYDEGYFDGLKGLYPLSPYDFWYWEDYDDYADGYFDGKDDRYY